MAQHAVAVCIAGLCLLLSGAPDPSHAAAPPAVQGIQARTQVQGIEMGRATFVTIGDPAKAEAIGLSGLKAGSTVEVTKTGESAWTVTDPATKRRVVLDKAPDLGK